MSHRHDPLRLQAELQQETEVKEMLEESVSELRRTLCELQERLLSVEAEGNEWKTRYETQVELNGQIKRQISLLKEKLEDMRGNPIDRLASIRSYEEMSVETLSQRLQVSTSEKSDLQTQLKDCHLQIDLEGKAFHKTNDERRAFLSEIAKTTTEASNSSQIQLSSTLEVPRHRTSLPHGPVESRQTRVKASSRRAEAAEAEEAEEASRQPQGPGGEVGGASAAGGTAAGVTAAGGTAAEVTAERRNERRSQRGSRLPTLQHYLKH